MKLNIKIIKAPEIPFKNYIVDQVEQMYMFKGDFDPDRPQLLITCKTIYTKLMSDYNQLKVGEIGIIFDKGIRGEYGDSSYKLTIETLLQWLDKGSKEIIISRAKLLQKQNIRIKQNEAYHKDSLNPEYQKSKYSYALATNWKSKSRYSGISDEKLNSIGLEEMKIKIDKWREDKKEEKEIYKLLTEMYL